MRRGSRTREGLAAAESLHLFHEAQRREGFIERVLLAESAAAELLPEIERAGIAANVVAEELFVEIATTENSQGVIALVRLDETPIASMQGRLVVLDGVQDPGNAGTIVRAAEAFGAAGIVFAKGSASPYNPKTLRAAAGSLFRLPFADRVEGKRAIEQIQDSGRKLWAASSQDGTPLAEARIGDDAIVVGSEAHGPSQAVLAAAESLHIPTTGVESLNAAMAATVILYEARRRESSGEEG